MSEGRVQAQDRETALAASLVGRTVAQAFIDGDRAACLVLDDGRALLVMSDPEGNGPGALHVYGAETAEADAPFLGILGGS